MRGIEAFVRGNLAALAGIDGSWHKGHPPQTAGHAVSLCWEATTMLFPPLEVLNATGRRFKQSTSAVWEMP
jgi:hypothetical protein